MSSAPTIPMARYGSGDTSSLEINYIIANKTVVETTMQVVVSMPWQHGYLGRLRLHPPAHTQVSFKACSQTIFRHTGKIGLVNGLFHFHSPRLQNCDVTLVGM